MLDVLKNLVMWQEKKVIEGVYFRSISWTVVNKRGVSHIILVLVLK